MIWGCFSFKGIGELQVIHGRMNGSMYMEILEKNLQKSTTSLGQGRNFVLEHDNDPKHTAKLTKEWFENNVISTLNWPNQSPDLNPIENLWNTLKVKVHKQNPQNIKQLEELCKEEWDKVMLDQCGKLVANYRKQLEAVKQNFDKKKKGFYHEFLIFLPYTTKTLRYYLPNIRQNGKHKQVITENNMYPILMHVTVCMYIYTHTIYPEVILLCAF